MSAKRRVLPVWGWSRDELDQWHVELERLRTSEGVKGGSLEHVLCRAVQTAVDALRELDDATRTIERYEKALTFYADPNNYDREEPSYGAGHHRHYPATIDSAEEYDFEPDGGETARAALGAHIREILVRRDGDL